MNSGVLSPLRSAPAGAAAPRIGPDRLWILALALVAAAYVAFAPELFNDGDTGWHLAAGKLILATGSIPRTDPFSFTFAGQPWTAHEWLAEIFMAASFSAGSWGGLAVLFAAAFGGLLLLLGLELRRFLDLRRTVIALLLVAIVLTPFTLARPHVLAWPMLAGWTILLLRGRAAHRAPPLAAALLMIVWANLHGSFALGLLLTGVFALDALVEERNRREALRGWSLFALASLLCSLFSPLGIEGLLFPIHVSTMTSLPLIMEWRSTDPAEDWRFLLVLAGLAGFVLHQRPRIAPVRLILLLGVTYLALAHVRHQPVLAIVATLVLAEPLSRKRQEERGAAHRHPLAAVAALTTGLAAIALVRFAADLPRQDSASNPITMIAQLPPELRHQPVLNSYGFGGSLILAGYRPFIDGRADIYGDDFLFEHQRIVRGDGAAFERAVDHWGIAWTILEPGSPLVARLDASPEWRRLVSDAFAVIHVRADVRDGPA